MLLYYCSHFPDQKLIEKNIEQTTSSVIPSVPLESACALVRFTQLLFEL